MKKTSLLVIILLVMLRVNAQEHSLAINIAHTITTKWKDSLSQDGGPVKWAYDQGVVLKGIEGLWLDTSDPQYFNYVQHSLDKFITSDGSILTYKLEDYNLDNVLCGRLLLMLYKTTGQEKYYKAAKQLRIQLRDQPRIADGGFWHKKRYPQQMWLDGLYMAEPFYTEWAATFKEDTAYNDIAKQFVLMEKYARDAKTGLLYHGYDQSGAEKWSDKVNKTSPNFWGRAMGWFGMALVDALDYFPEAHPQRKALINILQRYADAISRVQDNQSGVWWDVLNFPNREGNYLESSASSMFVYTLAKGVRKGYLSSTFLPVAQKGYKGIVDRFVRKSDDGQVNLEGTVAVSGLGGTPYRDGGYAYYVHEKVVTNDPKGIGAFLICCNEMNKAQNVAIGNGKTVLLDSWFNNEYKKDAAGIMQPFHYKWEDRSNGGFSLLGYLFNDYGFDTKTLHEAPASSNLKQARVYIIVDPDNLKEVPDPHYIEEKDVNVIYNWVKEGGVLVMMANDSANVELPHFNKLAHKFGIHWSDSSRNMVKDNKFAMGAIHIGAGNPIFTSTKKIYLKEICLINLQSPAHAVVSEDGDVIIAVAKVGKGTVFAVGDPWLYNEYTDGRKIPADYENATAAKELIVWLSKQIPK